MNEEQKKEKRRKKKEKKNEDEDERFWDGYTTTSNINHFNVFFFLCMCDH